MEKVRAERNRTITMNDEEILRYSNMCINSDMIDMIDMAGGHILKGNALDILPRMPGDFVDLLIVDPPYNLNKTFGETKFKKLADDKYRDFTEKWIKSVTPLLKKNATIYVCCDWKSSLIIGTVLSEHFTIQNRITWQREKGRGSAYNWKNSMEDIWFATVSSNNYTFNVQDVKMRRRVIAPYRIDGKPKDWVESSIGNLRDTCPSNFWDDISVPYWSMPENTDHPTQKPEKLIAKLILASSNPGDMVFDPFLGSGTTVVTAKKLGRRYCGIETDPVYCALANKRLEMAGDDSEIQGYSDGVFWERNTLALQQKFKNNSRQILSADDETCP